MELMNLELNLKREMKKIQFLIGMHIYMRVNQSEAPMSKDTGQTIRWQKVVRYSRARTKSWLLEFSQNRPNKLLSSIQIETSRVLLPLLSKELLEGLRAVCKTCFSKKS